MPEIETARLRITPFTLDRVHAALADRNLLQTILGTDVPDTWPGTDFAEVLPFLAQAFLEDPSLSEWSGLIIHRADGRLIGDIGFKTVPDAEGCVELGYSVVPEYRRQGYASEAARAMVAWAFEQPGVKRVTAECLNDNEGSIGVLRSIPMHQTGRDGPLLHWEVRREDLKG